MNHQDGRPTEELIKNIMKGESDEQVIFKQKNYTFENLIGKEVIKMFYI